MEEPNIDNQGIIDLLDLEQINEENKQDNELIEKKNIKNDKKKIIKKKDPIPILLYPSQIKHKDHLEKILEKNPFALDLSMLGTGKTYTSSKIFTENNFKHLIVIAPVSVKTKWKYMEKEHGINIYKSISFCELRSIRFKQPKHGLLLRKDYMTNVTQKDGSIRQIEKTSFTCTQKYLDLIEEGVLLVIDEIQNIKNINDQLYACKELIKPIVKNFKNNNSRILLLSGSPIDKKVQTIHLFKSLNIMNEDRLSVYNPKTYSIMWRGMKEIEDYFIQHFGLDKVNNIKNSLTYFAYYGYINDRELEEYCYKLFQQLFKKYCSHAMLPLDIKTTIIKQNAFYNFTVNNVKLLIKGIKLLKKATRYNHNDGTINHGTDGIAALRSIQRALTMIETSKIECLARVAKQQLSTTNKKIVICVNYIATIDDLLEDLKDYNPLRLDGSLSAKKRLEVLEKFQLPNHEYRVLIGNLTVCSTGIDLDDQHGKFPRLCLVSPNYNTISLYQLSHRFQRANTKSDAIIHFVFGNLETTELPILNALAKKSNIMKEITKEQSKHGIIFPGDYEKWIEPTD